MVRVLVDAHMLGSRETGNEAYTLNLVRCWRTFEAHGFQISVAVQADYSPEPAWQRCAVRLPRSSDLHRLLVGLHSAARSVGAVGMHVTYHAPLWTNLPYVVTIHDVSYRVRVRQHRLRNVVLQNLLGALSAWRARAVITDSEFSRGEIERVYPFLRGRIFVMLGAADEQLAPRSPAVVQQTLDDLGIRPPYVLWVGAFQARKNVHRLVKAFVKVLADLPHYQLVLVANPNTALASRIQREYAEKIAHGQIVLTGYIDSRDTLACLYSGCEAFVFPSLYEGFGLPVLEAMQCGAPVVTSNVTALPEVAGDAAILVDPTDIDAIAHALRHLLTNAELRAVLRNRGFQRAAQFSWSKSASLVADAYKLAFGMS